MTLDFPKCFKALTDNEPFPWQCQLYDRFVADRPDNIPSSCDLPTGLGKTLVVAIWLIALAVRPKTIPRRLVYVVNRRTVVDQTTDEVTRLRRNLAKIPALMKGLTQLCATESDDAVPLAISTLRGQFADNREWSADPSRPAVICGTVDMIGSRLLFSGYGVGFRTKPLHAAFLGQDALLVHDEAHLEPAFQQLLETVECVQLGGRWDERLGCVDQGKQARDFRPLRVMQLSATSRRNDDVFTLTADDKKDPTVKQRISAKKAIELHQLDDDRELADRIAELALNHKDKNKAVLVFARALDTVEKITAKLRKESRDGGDSSVEVLTGTLRGLERDALVKEPVFRRFLDKANRDEESGTVFLVCTSAGEVGVNISADHLVCDLSTFDSMTQRFGRVNRFGNNRDTRIDIVCPQKLNAADPIDQRRIKTLALLQSLDGNGSPKALGELNRELRLAAFAPLPQIFPATDILFDAWALSTIRERLPGRPPVEPYLHGKSDWEPPETQVAWRNEVEFVTDELIERYKPAKLTEDILDIYPVKPHELLRDRSDRVFKHLTQLSEKNPELRVWIVDKVGAVKIVTLDTLTSKGDKDRINSCTVLLPPAAGGLREGLLDGDSATASDVADEWYDAKGRLRQRTATRDSNPDGMKSALEITSENPDDEDAEPKCVCRWFVRPRAEEWSSFRSKKKYLLQPHLDDAAEFAEMVLAKLYLPDAIRESVVFASRFHDLGKHREAWQNNIGNKNYPKEVWAKSGIRSGSGRLDYRHEFGSALDVAARGDFQDLRDDLKELVLHSIAAHHGRARPYFPPGEAIDLEQSQEASEQLNAAVPRRFARLQRKLGRWGLAYLESLVRIADILASKRADGENL